MILAALWNRPFVDQEEFSPFLRNFGKEELLSNSQHVREGEVERSELTHLDRVSK